MNPLRFSPINVGSGAAYHLSRGRIGSDFTPEGSATNVAKTQMANATGTKVDGLNYNSAAAGPSQTQLQQLHSQGNQVRAQQQAANDTFTQNPGGAGAGVDYAQEQAYWDDIASQADWGMGQLANQRNIGYGNLNNSYTRGRAELDAGKQAAQKQYDTTTARTTRDNVQAKAQLDDKVGRQLTGLQRLLGSRGAGQGSTATVLAPFSVGQQGNQQRAQIQQGFGDNMEDLQNNWAATDNQYQTAYGDLDADRDNKRRELDANLLEKEMGFNDTKSNAAMQRAQAGGKNYQAARAARAPYQSRIQQLLGQIDSLSANTTFQPKQVAYQDPTLRSYDTGDMGGVSASTPQQQAMGPYWNLAQNDERKRQLA